MPRYLIRAVRYIAVRIAIHLLAQSPTATWYLSCWYSPLMRFFPILEGYHFEAETPPRRFNHLISVCISEKQEGIVCVSYARLGQIMIRPEIT